LKIVDRKTGELLDSFEAYDPVVSPDQHWLIMRDFYPAQSEVSDSEEYLLYDLTKDPAGNTVPNRPAYTGKVRGRVVYPVVAQGVPFEHSGLDDKQRHGFGSKSFYWAPGGQAVVFADITEGFSIVMVEPGADGTNALVHQLSESEVCEQGAKASIRSAGIAVADARIGTDRTVELQFKSSDTGACNPLRVILHREDFKPAQMETHPPRHRPGIPVLGNK
jgi:hypothetical protein